MLEKGKGPIINKLRTIQLIEADLQLIMYISIGNQNSDNIKIDRRISKYNFGSRRNYSIKTALLEKRMIYDASKYDGKMIIYNLTDLEACYNR